MHTDNDKNQGYVFLFISDQMGSNSLKKIAFKEKFPIYCYKNYQKFDKAWPIEKIPFDGGEIGLLNNNK